MYKNRQNSFLRIPHQKSASKLGKTEKTRLRDACKFTKVDFLSEVEVDDSKIRDATDKINSLWTANKKPSWFPPQLWDKKFETIGYFVNQPVQSGSYELLWQGWIYLHERHVRIFD